MVGISPKQGLHLRDAAFPWGEP